MGIVLRFKCIPMYGGPFDGERHPCGRKDDVLFLHDLWHRYPGTHSYYIRRNRLLRWRRYGVYGGTLGIVGEDDD